MGQSIDEKRHSNILRASMIDRLKMPESFTLSKKNLLKLDDNSYTGYSKSKSGSVKT